MTAVMKNPLMVANEHALASIIRTASTHAIVASEDIVDDRGQKLWARNQPVTANLQQRLLERKLKQPLEACLRVEDGVTAHVLGQELETTLASDHALALPLKPWSAALIKQAYALPLHAAVSLLLTVSRQTHPAAFQHAILGMALAGVMATEKEKSGYDVRLCMLGGLLHDIGEMYINPEYLDDDCRLNARHFKHMLVHPRIGAMLMAELTDYPEALARGIGEHQERLNGGGYPAHLQAPAISDMGALLGVVETTLGATSRPSAHPLLRASLALRAVPGEFAPRYSDVVVRIASKGSASGTLSPSASVAELAEQGRSIEQAMQGALTAATNLTESDVIGASLKQAAQRMQTVLMALQVGWHATGMWSPLLAEVDASEQFEAELLQTEFAYRLGALGRDCTVLSEALGEKDAARLSVLSDCLQIQTTA